MGYSFFFGCLPMTEGFQNIFCILFLQEYDAFFSHWLNDGLRSHRYTAT